GLALEPRNRLSRHLDARELPGRPAPVSKRLPGILQRTADPVRPRLAVQHGPGLSARAMSAPRPRPGVPVHPPLSHQAHQDPIGPGKGKRRPMKTTLTLATAAALGGLALAAASNGSNP